MKGDEGKGREEGERVAYVLYCKYITSHQKCPSWSRLLQTEEDRSLDKALRSGAGMRVWGAMLVFEQCARFSVCSWEILPSAKAAFCLGSVFVNLAAVQHVDVRDAVAWLVAKWTVVFLLLTGCRTLI